jgi:hypothetical protein
MRSSAAAAQANGHCGNNRPEGQGLLFFREAGGCQNIYFVTALILHEFHIALVQQPRKISRKTTPLA